MGTKNRNQWNIMLIKEGVWSCKRHRNFYCGNPQDAFLLEPELLLSFFQQQAECFMAQVVHRNDEPLHLLPDVNCHKTFWDSAARHLSSGEISERECPLQEVAECKVAELEVKIASRYELCR